MPDISARLQARQQLIGAGRAFVPGPKEDGTTVIYVLDFGGQVGENDFTANLTQSGVFREISRKNNTNTRRTAPTFSTRANTGIPLAEVHWDGDTTSRRYVPKSLGIFVDNDSEQDSSMVLCVTALEGIEWAYADKRPSKQRETRPLGPPAAEY